MTNLARKTLYRTRPDFRAHVLARVKSRHERDKADPDYLRLVALRKRIYSTRERIAMWLDKVRRAERRLIDMVRERDEIAARRRTRKAGR